MSRPALFLDRDGVVNRDDDFVHRAEDFAFQPGIFELVRRANGLGHAVVVITNQSGIARGLYGEDDYLALDAWMRECFASALAPIAASYFCPYHPQAVVPRYRHPDHPWRKPRPGMLLQARADLDLDLSRSAIIGDRWSDVLAGAAAGVPHLALLGTRSEEEPRPPEPPPVRRLRSLAEATRWLQAVSAA